MAYPGLTRYAGP